MSNPALKPLTRAERERSRQCWENLISLIEKEFKGLEGWMTKDANPKVTELHKLLTGDLRDVDARWECETMISIIVTLNKTGLGKIAFHRGIAG